MNEMTRCGNPETLVTYVYDECEPVERDLIATHLAECVLCAAEVQALRDTRAHLGAWTPPALALGFQVTRTDGDQPSKVLQPAAWWRQPLPAWAQAAAAAVIFAAGLGVGAVRSTDVPSSAAAVAARPVETRVTAVAQPVVPAPELARLEQRLRTLEANQTRQTSISVERTAAPPDYAAYLESIRALDQRLAENEAQSLSAFSIISRRFDAVERDVDNLGLAVRVGLGPSLAQRAALTTR